MSTPVTSTAFFDLGRRLQELAADPHVTCLADQLNELAHFLVRNGRTDVHMQAADVLSLTALALHELRVAQLDSWAVDAAQLAEVLLPEDFLPDARPEA